MAVEIDRYAIAGELFPDQPPGFPFENFDLERLRLPADDDMGIPSEDDEGVADEDIQTESGFGSVIVVGNLPAVPKEKVAKLQTVIEKIYSQIGTIRDGGIFMPFDEAKGLSKGFAFIEFSNPQEAQAAREQTQGYRLDKNHVFAVNMFDDFEKYAKVPDEYQAPEPKAFTPQEGLHSWLLDKMARDQFVLRHGDHTAVHWNDGKRGRSDVAYERQFWTESFVQWSPHGNLLATMHRQGVAVWGGPEFVRLMRFSHQNPRLIDFSPGEKYLVTYSSSEPTNPRDNARVVLNVFDVRSGRKLRPFEGSADEFAAAAGAIKWPVLKWSGGKDDKYVARLGRGAVSIYETPEMTLLDKKSFKAEGLQDFEWSPSDDIMAVYQAEHAAGQMPSRISLVRIPERTELRQKNLFNVASVSLHWHPQGDYFAVKVERYTKTKKSTYFGFELFAMRDRDTPMVVLEPPNKADKVLGLAWEPRGHRFAVVHGDGPRPSVSFYTMRDDKGRLAVRHLGTLNNEPCNQVHWSPTGRNILLAGLKNLNGQLKFFNVDEFETMAAAEHFMCTGVEWDPTGRYIATSVTSIHQMENGFNLWSFHGKLLYTKNIDRLFQFSWRPRLASLLSPEREAEIAKNLKAYSKRYDEEDEALLLQADADVVQERKRLQAEFRAYLDSKKALAEAITAFKRAQYGARFAEREFSLTSAVMEHVLDVKEEPANL